VGEKAARQGKQGIFFMVKSNQDDLQHISSMLADGTLRPHISQVFEFSEIKAAHTQIETGKTRGKIVLKL
jgi:NADPH:quinone reductase-like Zn-dependent oxidoreductase